jgi:hypothetical protein
VHHRRCPALLGSQLLEKKTGKKREDKKEIFAAGDMVRAQARPDSRAAGCRRSVAQPALKLLECAAWIICATAPAGRRPGQRGALHGIDGRTRL